MCWPICFALLPHHGLHDTRKREGNRRSKHTAPGALGRVRSPSLTHCLGVLTVTFPKADTGGGGGGRDQPQGGEEGWERPPMEKGCFHKCVIYTMTLASSFFGSVWEPRGLGLQ